MLKFVLDLVRALAQQENHRRPGIVCSLEHPRSDGLLSCPKHAAGRTPSLQPPIDTKQHWVWHTNKNTRMCQGLGGQSTS